MALMVMTSQKCINGGGVNLVVSPKIRKVEKVPSWGAITPTISH